MRTLFLILLASVGSCAHLTAPLSQQEVIASKREAIVYIHTFCGQVNFYGTGFIIDNQTVATVNHVVTDADCKVPAISFVTAIKGNSSSQAKVFLGSSRKFTSHPSLDLSKIHFPAGTFNHYPKIAIPRDITVKPGDSTITFGYPGGFPFQYISQGIVYHTEDEIYVSTFVKTGNSGGLVIRLPSGECAGIVVQAYLEPLSPVAYLIPCMKLWDF